MRSVVDDDWSALRRVIDVVPGTLLLEDSEAPVLIFPVDAESPGRASLFVDGVTRLTGLEVVSGKVYPEPANDFELDEEPETALTQDSSPVVDAVHDWVDGVDAISGYVTGDGRLVRS